MRHFWLVGPLVFLLGSCTVTTFPVDEAVSQQLTRMGLTIQTDPDGDLYADITPEWGRKQRVWIRSHVNTWNHIRIREVFSVARVFRQDPPRSLLTSLMEDNYKNRFLGSWSLLRNPDDGSWLLVFLVKLSAHPYNPLLVPAIQEAAEAADGVEKSLSGEDQF